MMHERIHSLREQARAIWKAAVDDADPAALLGETFKRPSPILRDVLNSKGRILVVGAGKAGATMAAGLEEALADQLDLVVGIINVPNGSTRPLRKLRLNFARPVGSNHPTAAGVAGTTEMLNLLSQAGSDDVAICLLSGGGSALMPAPVEGVALEDKQEVTRLLHACGATIDEMNCVRKHLSRVKGGRLVEAFRGRLLVSLIISDVIGDPLDVIASGPTAPDPTTFADAVAVIDRYALRDRIPPSALSYLETGRSGGARETPKSLPTHVHNFVIGNNARSLAAAARKAVNFGWPVLNLGSFLEGDTQQLAIAMTGIVRSIHRDRVPAPPPICLVSGGETTVDLGEQHGKGGRNQEFVLAAMLKLGQDGMRDVVVLSGGTDGEDGPTDAAGAIADHDTLDRAERLQLDAATYLGRHDAYSYFDAAGGLLKTGLTETNVMDVRIILIGEQPSGV